MKTITPFRWMGGKSTLASKILSYLPEEKIYVEPFCGSAALLFHKHPSPVEVLNDLDSNIVNLFRVLQDKDLYKQLEDKIKWTLYSREEFITAFNILKAENMGPIEKAWAFYVTQNQGFGGVKPTVGRWGRAFIPSGDRAMTASQWGSRQQLFGEWQERLMRVQIDHIDALECIKYWDSPETVFYIDPPYIESTRKSGKYLHDTVDDFHTNLCTLLLNLQGKAVLSGYNDNVTYQPLSENGWSLVELDTVCRAAAQTRTSGLKGKGKLLENQRRTECLWIKGSKKNLFN